MKYCLRFLCFLFALVGYISADNLQDFIDGVAELHKTYESKQINYTQFFKGIDSLSKEKLGPKEKDYIDQAKIPQGDDLSKISEKYWKRLERRIFAKVLLYALYGYPKDAEVLLGQFEEVLLFKTVVTVVPSGHPWIILWDGISISKASLIYYMQTECIKLFGKDTDWTQQIKSRVQSGSIGSYDEAYQFLEELYRDSKRATSGD